MSAERDRPVYDPVDKPPDERASRPAEENLAEVRRGRATSTPFALVGGVALTIAVAVGVLVLVTLLIYLL